MRSKVASVTDARHLLVRRCVFNDTYGAPPQCGVDIEPNEARDYVTDVVFEDCAFDGNAASGFDMYFCPLTAATEPVSVVYRRCSARGNRRNGITFMTGNPKNIVEKGQVRGTVRFEDCSVADNKAEALKIINHTCQGMEIGFYNCTFDARGSRAEAALMFDNGQVLRDFGPLTFENCRVILDKGHAVCDFDAQEGIGIGGRLKGVLKVECEGRTSDCDLAAFAAKHVPHPELVSVFRSMMVDYRALKAPPPATLKGVRTPSIRNSFVFVQAVPAAGEYKLNFKSRKLRKSTDGKPCGVVQLLDAAGTDLGKFDVPEGDFTYTLKATGANVYRFEVAQKNGSAMSVSTTTPGGALLTDRQINLFGGGATFSFRVPAATKEVKVNLCPEEPASAVLLDASGKKVAEMPYQTKRACFKVKRAPTAADEVWTLKLPRIAEDLGVQIGGDALPLLSTERASTIRMK